MEINPNDENNGVLMSLLSLMAFSLAAIFSTNIVLNNEEWKWSDEQASILYYFLKTPKSDSIQLVRNRNAGWQDVRVRIGGNEEEAQLEFDTHREGAFVFSDQVVIYAQFGMYSNGCELVAFDLDKEEEIWRNSLDGIGAVPHSKYRNQINLEIRKDVVVVYGNELGGKYIETRDIKSGGLVAHQRF